MNQALFGGALIGLAASLLLLLNGRIAGVSGILYGLLTQRSTASVWRWCFIFGLFCGGVALRIFYPEAFGSGPDQDLWSVSLAGILVGYGAVLGNGCTSGHGVCGVGRLSLRSAAATLVFMVGGFFSVWLVRTWSSFW